MEALLPNGALTSVPGNGTSVTVNFNDTYDTVSSTHSYSPTTSMAFAMGSGRAALVTAYVPWPANATGLRGATVEYSTDSGATWHTVGTDCHQANLNNNGSSVACVFLDTSVPTFPTVWFRLRVFQNTGSTISLTGPSLTAQPA